MEPDGMAEKEHEGFTNPPGRAAKLLFFAATVPIRDPALGVSAVMHWLVSQSIFLIAVERHDPQGTPALTIDVSKNHTNVIIEGEHYSCGWSPLAVLLVICGGLLMIAWAIGMGQRKYHPGMPLGGTNSAVIAAACHMAGEEGNIEYKKVKWGVVGEYDTDGTEHCAFSSEEPAFPQDGVVYK
jgi:hypothetical protein